MASAGEENNKRKMFIRTLATRFQGVEISDPLMSFDETIKQGPRKLCSSFLVPSLFRIRPELAN
jgi:hypothetical protein